MHVTVANYNCPKDRTGAARAPSKRLDVSGLLHDLPGVELRSYLRCSLLVEKPGVFKAGLRPEKCRLPVKGSGIFLK
jgi:hypothetical protein